MNKHTEKQEYVLQIVLRTFLWYGFKKTSMDDIAKAAGLTHQGLYFHYRSKDKLLRACVEKALFDGHRAVHLALSAAQLPLEERLYRALGTCPRHLTILSLAFDGIGHCSAPTLIP